jgi:hypothetical protein
MKKLTTVLLLAAAALACRGRSAPAQRTQQQYDVVQEGQTTSATSTIDAPGEVRPPIATATNTDTTGSFTLPTTTVPPQQPGAMSSGMPPPAPAPRPPAPIVITTQPRPVERRPPPPTETTDTAPPTDTAATETTQTDTIGHHRV